MKNKKILIGIIALCMFVIFTSIFINLSNKQNNKTSTKDKENNVLTYKNVLLIKCENDTMEVNLGNEIKTFDIYGFNESVSNTMADIEVRGNNIEGVVLKKETIKGKIQSIKDDGIEIEGFGNIDFSKDFKCYLRNGKDSYSLTEYKSVNVGMENVKFVVEDRYICGILIDGENSHQNIRVLLKNTGFSDYFHENALFGCESDFEIYYNVCDSKGNVYETKEEHNSTEEINMTASDDKLKYGRIRVVPKDENGKIYFKSFTRNTQSPYYRGNIEIANYAGRLVIINEVSLDEYLYSVVPSEMPDSYGIEALKVQAVCARSYALCHLDNSKLSVYGAQVDDSVDFQVYNNTLATDNSIAAVNATSGQVMTYNGEIVNAYFYSTSCGATTDSSIWGDNCLPYTASSVLTDEKCSYDLKNEKDFLEFIKSDYKTYDSDNSWYRWHINLDYDGLTDIVNYNLKKVCDVFPSYVMVMGENGEFENRYIESVGYVREISVIERGAGGIINVLQIKGDLATIRIIKQSAIRNLLNPYGYEIVKNDGSINSTMSSFPSAFFAICDIENGVIIYGGGYGHGVGMSQSAVNNMIKAGMGYEEILRYFYKDIAIEIR